MTPDERQRIFLGLVMCAHDGNEAGFRALLNGVSRAELTVMLRNMAEVVVAGQLATEDRPGAERDRLAAVALAAAGR